MLIVLKEKLIKSFLKKSNYFLRSAPMAVYVRKHCIDGQSRFGHRCAIIERREYNEKVRETIERTKSFDVKAWNDGYIHEPLKVIDDMENHPYFFSPTWCLSFQIALAKLLPSNWSNKYNNPFASIEPTPKFLDWGRKLVALYFKEKKFKKMYARYPYPYKDPFFLYAEGSYKTAKYLKVAGNPLYAWIYNPKKPKTRCSKFSSKLLTMEFERERYERIKRIVNKYMYYANGRIYIRTKRTDEKGSKESQFINLILTTTYAAYMTEVLFIRRLSMFKVRHRDFCHYFLICNFKTSGALYLSFTWKLQHCFFSLTGGQFVKEYSTYKKTKKHRKAIFEAYVNLSRNEKKKARKAKKVYRWKCLRRRFYIKILMMRYVRRAAISMRVRVISWFCRGLVHNFSRFIFEVCFGLSRARRRIPKDTRILRTRFLFFTNKTLLVNTERRVKRTSLKKLRLCR